MSKKKVTQWEKNLKAVERAQKNALKRIEELEKRGYKVSKNVKKAVEKDVTKKRWTSAEVEKYRKVTANVSRIKSYAEKKTVYKAAAGVERVFIKKASEKTNIKQARQFTNDLQKNAMNLNRGSAKLISMLFGQFGSALGIKSDFALLSRKFSDIANVGNILKGAKTSELTKIVSTIMGSEYGDAFVKAIYATPFLKESKDKIKAEQLKAAKETFGENFAVGEDTVNIMYDFFDSDAWQKYKNSKYSYYNEEELRDFVESVDKEGITGDELKRILVLIEGGSSLRKAVEIVKGK
jgi:hypothetical protein